MKLCLFSYLKCHQLFLVKKLGSHPKTINELSITFPIFAARGSIKSVKKSNSRRTFSCDSDLDVYLKSFQTLSSSPDNLTLTLELYRTVKTQVDFLNDSRTCQSADFDLGGKKVSYLWAMTLWEWWADTKS